MVKIIAFESAGTKITQFRTNLKGKAKKVIPFKDHRGDRQKLEKKAEKHKD